MDWKLLAKGNVYETIVAEYRKMIETGILKEGEKLPSCRALAVEWRVNPNTVEKAYTKLEEEGLIVLVPKKGAYVTFSHKSEEAIAARKAALKELLEGMKKDGFSAKEAGQVFDEVFFGGAETEDDR